MNTEYFHKPHLPLAPVLESICLTKVNVCIAIKNTF